MLHCKGSVEPAGNDTVLGGKNYKQLGSGFYA